MNLCDKGHGEVCYEGAYCPACQEKNRRDGKINIVWEKYKHLDGLLMDNQWLSGAGFRFHILHDLWQAIRRENK